MAVVDEVQMMEDIERGGAWTRAILGEPVLNVCYSHVSASVALPSGSPLFPCVNVCQVFQQKRFTSVGMRVPCLW